MKKFLFAICLALLTTPSLWAYDFEVNGIYYNITDFGKSVSVTYKNTDYNSYSGNVVIPSTVTYNSTTYSVIYIGEFAFSDCTGLTAVTIPNSVIFIDRNAFMNCNGLTSITIPNSVISIDRNAFMNCNGLTSITIPEGVTSIGDGAFYGCTGLTSITIPNSVTSIGGSAFSGTPWYNNQPDGVIYAGAILYKYKGTMPAGTNIAVKEGTISISDYAFSGCTGLTSITRGCVKIQLDTPSI